MKPSLTSVNLSCEILMISCLSDLVPAELVAMPHLL